MLTVETGAALALVPLDVAVGPLPAGGAEAGVAAVPRVHAGGPVLARALHTGPGADVTVLPAEPVQADAGEVGGVLLQKNRKTIFLTLFLLRFSNYATALNA